MHLRSRSSRSRIAVLALVAGTISAVLFAAAVPPTYSIDTRHTGRLNKRGFPIHYTDDRGVQVQLCVNGTRRCLRTKRSDLLPPEGEAFYWAANTTVHSSRGPVDVELALEAAFGGAGRPIVFDRIRIRGHLRQAGNYILEHPYGQTRFRAITPLEQRNVNLTHDRMCSVKRDGPCPGRIDNFLRAKNPPKGYLGFGGRRTLVVGGTLRNSVVLKTAAGEVIGSNSKFAVLGDKVGRLR